MNRLRILALSILSALLLSLAWLKYFTPIVFIAFVPLLFIADEYFWQHNEKRKGLRKFLLFYLCFLIWNLLVTWWVYNASPAAVMAWTLNSLFMVWTLRLAWWVKKRFVSNWSYFIIIHFWLSFEYLHQQWDLSWTWLTLGNVFANAPELVQWFELTGTSGGSAWVLTINILFYLLIKKRLQFKIWSRKVALGIVFLFFAPILLSYALYVTVDARIKSSQLKAQHVVVVQPNIDPYNEKFVSDPQIQIEKALKLLSATDLKKADYLVFPETFLADNMWENDIPNVFEIQYLKEKLVEPFPKLTIVTGANTLKLFGPNEQLTPTAHKFTMEEGYYDSYNSAMQINAGEQVEIYRKSKLVPGSEIMPFLWLIKPLEKYALDLGGTVGSLGLQKERTAFKNKDGVGVAPVICYESVYPEYVTGYVKNGANMIFIITNDGWWGDTPGYKQHLAYGALRAIETRKPIARSANTGISAFVNEKGIIYNKTKWWEAAVIEADITPNNYTTVFVALGDIIAKISIGLAAVLFIVAVVKRFKRKKSE